MSLWVCLDCSTAFAVGAPLCPHCGSERHAEEGSALALGVQAGVPAEIEEDDDMPKITRHGGASIAGEEPEAAPAVDELEGGEDVSAGSSSETSSEKEPNSPEPSEKPTRSPARTTGSRSKKAATAKASTARSTDGDQAAGTSAADA